MSNQLPTQYQQFIHLSRYSRWLPDESRRETWSETITRYFDFFTEHLKDMCDFDLDDKTRKELEEEGYDITESRKLSFKSDLALSCILAPP